MSTYKHYLSSGNGSVIISLKPGLNVEHINPMRPGENNDNFEALFSIVLYLLVCNCHIYHITFDSVNLWRMWLFTYATIRLPTFDANFPPFYFVTMTPWHRNPCRHDEVDRESALELIKAIYIFLRDLVGNSNGSSMVSTEKSGCGLSKLLRIITPFNTIQYYRVTGRSLILWKYAVLTGLTAMAPHQQNFVGSSIHNYRLNN